MTTRKTVEVTAEDLHDGEVQLEKEPESGRSRDPDIKSRSQGTLEILLQKSFHETRLRVWCGLVSEENIQLKIGDFLIMRMAHGTVFRMGGGPYPVDSQLAGLLDRAAEIERLLQEQIDTGKVRDPQPDRTETPEQLCYRDLPNLAPVILKVPPGGKSTAAKAEKSQTEVRILHGVHEILETRCLLRRALRSWQEVIPKKVDRKAIIEFVELDQMGLDQVQMVLDHHGIPHITLDALELQRKTLAWQISESLLDQIQTGKIKLADF